MSLIVVFALFQKAVAVCGTRARETPRRESVRASADLTLAAGEDRPRGAGAVTKTPSRTYASARGRSVVRARESCVGWFAPFFFFCPTGRCQPSFKTMQSFFFFTEMHKTLTDITSS